MTLTCDPAPLTVTLTGATPQVTVLGEATKAHILTPLLPSTTYDIKLQAFNLEGGVSAFSQIITERTEGELKSLVWLGCRCLFRTGIFCPDSVCPILSTVRNTVGIA